LNKDFFEEPGNFRLNGLLSLGDESIPPSSFSKLGRCTDLEIGRKNPSFGRLPGGSGNEGASMMIARSAAADLPGAVSQSNGTVAGM